MASFAFPISKQTGYTAFSAAVSVAATAGATKLSVFANRVGAVALKQAAAFAVIYNGVQLAASLERAKPVRNMLGQATPYVSTVVAGAVAHLAMNSRFVGANLSLKVSAVLTGIAFLGGLAAAKAIGSVPTSTRP